MNDSKLINKNMGRPGMRNMNCQRMYGMNSDVNNLYASNRSTNNNNNNNNCNEISWINADVCRTYRTWVCY